MPGCEDCFSQGQCSGSGNPAMSVGLGTCACQTSCDDSGDCNFFTYISDGGICNLYTTCSLDDLNDPNSIGLTSGPAVCPTTTTTTTTSTTTTTTAAKGKKEAYLIEYRVTIWCSTILPGLGSRQLQ